MLSAAKSTKLRYKLLCGVNTNALVNLLAIAENYHGGNAENSEALSNIGMVINIELADFHLALKLLVKLVKNGCLHTAGATPLCPEVHQDKTAGGYGIEIILCKMHYHGYFSFIS